MQNLKFKYWRDGRMWLGHLEDYPDYLTQAKTLSELKANLFDLYKDLAGGHIPCALKVSILEIA